VGGTVTESSTAVDSPNLRQLVAPFARPKRGKAVLQLVDTLLPFLLCWGLMAASVVRDWGYGWTLLLALPTAGLYVRLFIIQHDCGHGSFFADRRLDHLVGAALGMVTLFPYGYWKKTHAIHHATSGNLDRREFGDVETLTLREYRRLPRLRRLGYRLYRSAPVLLVLGPLYQFVIKHRFPFDIPFAWKKEWASVLWNNLALGLAIWGLDAAIGWRALVLVQLPVLVIAGAAGVWLFYVQHQFEEAYWERQEHWDADEAAIRGSSFLDLPHWLHWLTGNIGYHHIHHLAAKVPNYRLRECFESNPLLQRAPRLTLWSSLRCARLKLWDEESRRLIPFPRRHELRGAA
jgi:omega-6 fatty acid desaturase (delta-12 desaturase)